MAVKLHRCPDQWVKIKGHPCWRVEKALMDMGVEYERLPGPRGRGKRIHIHRGTGQRLYPAIEFEDGSWYREQSKDMERTIRDGRLMEQAHGPAPGPPVPEQPEPGSGESQQPEPPESDLGSPEVH
jgi:hypothetical protein